MDAMPHFLRRLVRVVGFVAAVCLVVGFSYRSDWVWRLYERHLDLSYGTHQDWQYLNSRSDVQWRSDGKVIINRRVDRKNEHMLAAWFEGNRFQIAGFWKFQCEPGESFKLLMVRGGVTDPTAPEVHAECMRIDDEPWMVVLRSFTQPRNVDLNANGFRIAEDFTHPRWGGFEESRRLDAIQTARKASAE